MSRRNNRQKVEEKTIEPIDYLDDLVNTSIMQSNEEPQITEMIEEPIVEPIIEPIEDKSYNVKVMHPSLRIRRAPNAQAEIVGLITDQGIYKILDEVNGWGKLDENKWIMLSYTQITTK